MKDKRILIISHAHPKFSKGGGEIAAYNMYKELNRQGYDCYFLAAHNNQKAHHGHTPFSTINPKEILFFSSPYDYFLQTSFDKKKSWKDFKSLLTMISPDIIHFHHYIHLGLETIRESYNYKKVNSDLKIFMTLHEYIAICANNGQMITKDSGTLCYKSDFIDCAKCFPEKNPTDFYLREEYIKSFFDLIDHLISPSHFLIDRYIQWGLDKNRLTMLENGQILTDIKAKKRVLKKSKKRSKFAYFGQINTFKGLDVLLKSLDYLDTRTLKDLELYIHGTGLENQPQEFQDKINLYLESYSDNVTLYGRYEPEELQSLMEEIDWVIIPSSWWENSPLVIQEAFKFGKPIIASDIGGMREKVTNDIDGLHFKARNSRSLAEVLEKAIIDKVLYDKLYNNITIPLSIEESIQEHIKVYSSSIEGK